MRLLQGGLALVAVLCGVGMLAAELAFAQDAFKPEEGYVLLFNGKDLTGWRYAGVKDSLDGKSETPDKRFTVENGAIVANEGKGIKDLYTIREFDKDFNLKLEFRAGPKADSGVYIRGPQLQVRDYLGRGEQKHLKNFKNDDWNELDIIVKGGVVVTTVNGKPISDSDLLEVVVKGGKPEVKLNGKPVDIANVQVSVNNVATCRCNGEDLSPKTMNIPAKGPIGLQAETGKFEFRRVRIKELQ
jgi:hypothetical protein